MATNLYIDNNAKIYNNIANNKAPGIFNKATIYLQDNRDILNGLYIDNRDAVARITANIEAGSAIQLDNTDYVTPNPDLAPIVVAEATPSYPFLTKTDLNGFIKPPEGFEKWDLILYNDSAQIVLIPRIEPVYTITYYNLKGMTHTNPESYTEDTPTIILSAPTSRPGILFLGWYGENGKLITEIPHGSTGNIYLTARWEIIEGCRCKIGYVNKCN